MIAGIVSGRLRATGRLPVQIPRHASTTGTYLQPPLGRGGGEISVIDPTALYPFGFGIVPGCVVYERIDVAGELHTSGQFTAIVRVRNDVDEQTTEVVQLYLTDPIASVARPVRQLIGFSRVALDARRVGGRAL